MQELAKGEFLGTLLHYSRFSVLNSEVEPTSFEILVFFIGQVPSDKPGRDTIIESGWKGTPVKICHQVV